MFRGKDQLEPFSESRPLVQSVTTQFSGTRVELLGLSDLVFPLRFWVTGTTRFEQLLGKWNNSTAKISIGNPPLVSFLFILRAPSRVYECGLWMHSAHIPDDDFWKTV